jgi:hypothetical protein
MELYLSGDRAVTVFVEEGKCFLELSDLFLIELISHYSIRLGKLNNYKPLEKGLI